MKKTLLSLILMACVSWGFQPPRMYKSLQDLALCPLGLHIQDTLFYTPGNIRGHFGPPDSVQEQKTVVGRDSIYFYKNKTITFHATGRIFYLSLLEIISGRVGDLSIGMTRNEIDSIFGKVGIRGGREVRTFGEDDQYELWLDFESDRLIRVTPDWSRASLEMLGIYR